MSFKDFTQQTNLFTRPDHYPIFLLPDITGDGNGLKYLAGELQTALANKNRIYIWHDPVPSPQKPTLAEYAARIKQDIKEKVSQGPYYIAGYSFGGALASLVAQQLKAENNEVAVFIIDAPPIPLSQKHLQPHNLSATQDFISIFNYAARLARSHINSGPKELLLNLDKEAIKRLSQTSISNQLETLKNNLLDLCCLDKNLMFVLAQYCDVITQNLMNLIHHKNDLNVRLDKIGVVSALETCIKYNTNIAESWQPFCQEVLAEQPLDAEHTTLIADQNNRLVALQMATHFKNSFSKNELVSMWLGAILQDGNELSISRILEEVGKKRRLPSSSSTDSISSISSTTAPTNSPNFSPNVSPSLFAKEPPQLPPTLNLRDDVLGAAMEGVQADAHHQNSLDDTQMDTSSDDVPQRKRSHRSKPTTLQTPGSFFQMSRRNTRSGDRAQKELLLSTAPVMNAG